MPVLTVTRRFERCALRYFAWTGNRGVGEIARMLPARRRFSFLLLLTALVAVGCRKKSPELHFQLQNGLRVDLYAAPTGEKSALALLFDVGADHDPPRRSGMAQLIGQLFATASRPGKPARTTAQLEAQYGTDFQARTTGDYTLYGVAVPAAQIMDELDDAALRMSSLTPTDTDLSRERSRLLAQVAAMHGGDPMLDAMTRAAEAVHPSRGMGQRGGIASELEAITLDEAEAFRRTYEGAANARLVVAGHIDLEAVAARIKASFGAEPAGKPPELRPETGARVAGTLVMSTAPRALAVAVPIPAPKDPLYGPFLVLASRLGGAAGPARAWKIDFDPLGRSDVLFVTAPIPAGTPAEPLAAKLRGELASIVDAPLADGDTDRTLANLGAAFTERCRRR
jgi:predicted Zn-dependent peptidase